MRKIPPTIWLIVISLFLSGCIESNSSGTKFSSLVGGSDESAINYYSSSEGSSSDGGSDSGSWDSGSGSSNGAEGHPNPEPASLALLGSGLLGLLGAKIRKNKKRGEKAC